MGMATAEAGERAFVTNQSDDSVSVVLLGDTMQVLATLHVGGRPAGVAVSPDGRHAYVSSPEGGYVSVLASEPPALLRRIELEGGPLGIAVHPTGAPRDVADSHRDPEVVV